MQWLSLPSRQYTWLTGRPKSMKTFVDTMRNRTGNLPVCSTFPEPTAQPRALSTELLPVGYIILNYCHDNHISVIELGYLLTCSGLAYPDVSSKVYHDSFCQLGSSVSLPRVIYFETFYLRVVSSFSCIPVLCPKLVLFLTPL
jgi:hypothetical protein